MQVSFGSAAHLRLPKDEMDRWLKFEQGQATQRGENNQRFWSRPFPFDTDYDEVAFLSGKDLERAEQDRPIEGWDFLRALGGVMSAMKGGTYTTTDQRIRGSRLLLNDQGTFGGGRGALYLHSPFSWNG